MFMMIMLIISIFQCSENRAMENGDVFKPVKIGGQGLLYKSMKENHLQAEIYVRQPTKSKGSASAEAIIDCTDVVNYAQEASHNTIVLPLTDIGEVTEFYLQKLTFYATASTAEQDGFMIVLVKGGNCRPGDVKWGNQLEISIPRDSVSRFLHECVCSGFFKNKDIFAVKSINSWASALSVGCFFDQTQAAPLAKFNKLNTGKFTVVVERNSDASGLSGLEISLKEAVPLVGLYDNLGILKPAELKKELREVLDVASRNKPEDETFIAGSTLCTSPVLGIRSREFNKIHQALPGLEKEILDRYPEELTYPKRTHTARIGAYACGAVALFLTYDAIRSTAKGEVPEVIKRKGLFAALFGIFAGGLGYVTNTLAAFKFRNFTDKADADIYRNIRYFRSVYNCAKEACEKKADAVWIAEAINMERVFAPFVKDSK